jgi:uncharacterized protein YbjT (DUF2867 family)
MADLIVVTGGTGTLGSHLVPRLVAKGMPVRVLSRRERADASGVEYVVGDLQTGAGVDDAMADATVIMHCASSFRGDERAAQNLIAAARRRAPTAHLVFVSIVGIDKLPMGSALDRAMFGYLGRKYATERMIESAGLPWTTLRATQFHDLIMKVASGAARLPVVLLPSGFRFQPVDADDVAERLADLATAEPAGRVPDFAGPEVLPIDDLVRGALETIGRRRRIGHIGLPGAAARAVRAGALLAPDHAEGRTTWAEFLARVRHERG